MELTYNGIEYESYKVGAKGSRFILYPETGKHTEDDVQVARNWLKTSGEHIISLQIRWKKQGDEIPPPQRIPNRIIIKNLNVEIGKYKAYIQELEDKLKIDDLLTPEDKKQLKKDLKYQEQDKRIKDQDKLIKKLRKESEGLIIKLNQK